MVFRVFKCDFFVKKNVLYTVCLTNLILKSQITFHSDLQLFYIR